MGKGKLWKWEENAEMDNVFEPDLKKQCKVQSTRTRKVALGGVWQRPPHHAGTGLWQGSTGWAGPQMAQPQLRGGRHQGPPLLAGAKTANQDGLTNVAFLRTRIEFIDQFFGPGEVADIWLTFSDPQPKDEKGTKRITSGRFIERYRKFLAPGGSVKVKSDSKLLYALSKEDYVAAGYPFLHDSDDVYGGFLDTVDADLREALEIKTYYEQRWLEEGKNIHFMEIVPPAL